MTSARQPDQRPKDRRRGGRRAGDAFSAVPVKLTDVDGWIGFFRRLTYIRYLVVSVAALAVDLGMFLLLLTAGVTAVVASALGYSLGILVHWLLSSRKVFHDRVSERGSAQRTQQKAMFVMSALLGLALTIGIVGAGAWLGLDPRIAKLAAIGVSFQLTYVLRNIIIFRSAQVG
jgi:putative flippase GtrA